jgi:hypothetical protein
MTMRVIGVAWFKLPEAPVTVTVFVPVAAPGVAVKVSVLPAVELVGLNVAVTPLGKPEADRLTPEANPLSALTMIMLVLLPPGVTARLPGAAERLKSAVAAVVRAATLRLKVTVRTRPPPVPTIVTVAGLGLVGAVLLAAKVTVLVLVALAGLNEAVTRLGRLNADKLMLLSKPSPLVIVIVVVTLDP